MRSSLRPVVETTIILVHFMMAAARPSVAAGAVVEQFSPQGEVKTVRQVVARFSAPMVPLGDPRGGVSQPFDIECGAPGTARWVDSRNWVYDFDQDLSAGVRCSFTVRLGVVTLSGAAVKTETFSFSTGGPAVMQVTPWPEGEVDEDQVFVLFLDGEAVPESVVANVWFSVAGIAEKVGARIVDGDDRKAILTSLDRDPTDKQIVVVQARQRFPNGAAIVLSWGKGIASPSGVTTSAEQSFSFKAREPFSVKFSCARENAKADCLPLAALELNFTEAVPADRITQIVLRSNDGREWKPKPPDHGQPTSWARFAPPFPERSTFTLELPADLRDEAARSLANAAQFPLTVKTGPYPPLAKFPSRFGIIESEAEPALPVTVRNIEPEVQGSTGLTTAVRETGLTASLRDLWNDVTGNVVRLDPSEPGSILPWLRRVAYARRSASVFDEGLPAPQLAPKAFALPKPLAREATEVLGIPLEAPGLYVVEIKSPQLGAALLGKDAPMYVAAAALVTNMSVHLKWGGASSLVWVTSLNDAQPVAGAEIIVQNCRGDVVWNGTTAADGIARIDNLPAREQLPSCYGEWSPPRREGEDTWLDYDYSQTSDLRSMAGGLLVIARTRGDISFVHSSWQRGIESWRFRLPDASDPTPVTVHTIFDRTLFRAGETVHMKHLVRLKTLAGFDVVPADQRPTSLSIEHEGSNDKYDMPVEWDASGAAEGVWKIPERAKLGRYRTTLKRGDSWQSAYGSGSFRVEEFRIPLMRARVGLPAAPQVRAAAVAVDLEAHYLAGGAAARLPVVVRSQVRPKSFRAPDFENFTFANGTVQPGVTRASPYEYDGEPQPAVHQRQELELEESGTARVEVTELPAVTEPKDLLVEMEYRDPNGERQTVASAVPLWPAATLVGIDVEDWASDAEKLLARLAVVDVNGKPAAGAKVRVEAFKRTTYSHRQRLAGGFYAYEHVTEVTPSLGVLCDGVTGGDGRYFCEAAPPQEGNLILVASTEDASGHTSSAHAEVWVTGDSQWWFDVSQSDRIDVLPEQPRYEPGDTARLQVRMPFAEATALVSVEREGVAETQVVQLSGKNPVIEVPMLDSYAPNVFISVLVVRGRIGGVQPTAMLDLGRPAYKLGICEVRVGWRAHELVVKVESERDAYRVREKATARIQVRTARGEAPPPGSEVAFAAVDEGLLELQPNESWNLLAAMMGRRGYNVETATAQMQVIGKRHYGLKALPQGGGGGRRPTRELFDTLLLWQGRVALDAAGDAVVEVPLNDSLTSFRLVAVATGGVGLFGMGSTSIRATQDLMILASLPPVVREGDRLRAEVTLRNTTDRALDVKLTGTATGLGTLAPQSLSLAAGAATQTGWDVTIPNGIDGIDYEFDASEAGGAVDSLRKRQEVLPAVPVRTFQATLAQCKRTFQQPIRKPDDALPGRGEVRVALSPSLIAGLDGVRQWIADYTYTCFEQQLARAVILKDQPQHWTELSEALPSYLDQDGLVKFFATMTRGSEGLTAHVLSLTNEAGLELPQESLNRMLEGLRRFVDGEIRIDSWSGIAAADLVLRKLAAIEALARYGMARPDMLDSITIEPNLWPTSGVLNWWSILLRLPALPGQAARLDAAEQILRSRLDLAGTSTGFSSHSIDSMGWLLVSPDVNPLRLILTALTSGDWDEDLPRLAKAALDLQRRGAWDSTISNAWGSVAVEKFAQRFEADKVTGVTSATLQTTTKQVDWSQPQADRALDLPWPPSAATLSIEHAGMGAPWTVIQSRAAIPLRQPLDAGYHVEKTIAPVEVKTAGAFSAGDILRVRITVKAQRDMTWVVIDDPLPAGASHIGTGLARDSAITSAENDQTGWCAPVFVERSFVAIHAYYECLPKGESTFEYTIRLNQAGTFNLPTTRVEALYVPEMFGELPNTPVTVLP